jgi:surface antigen
MTNSFHPAGQRNSSPKTPISSNGYGHVAFVESVNVDGSWIVSEMNFVAFNAVDRRLIRSGGVPLIGFIY